MFGLFGKKHKPSIIQQDKDWIEDNIAWFIELFGLSEINQPFIIPTAENFPYNDLRNPDQFQRLFEQVCKYWDLDPNDIVVKLFDDITSNNGLPGFQTKRSAVTRSGFTINHIHPRRNVLRSS